VDSPPSAFAAGVVARQELAFGIQHGPANVLAVGPVGVADPVTPRRHDELHQAAVNVFMAERDGVRLTAGRTLSRDPLWRQLSVRRLVTMVGRTLTRQMQWTVFEPNNEELWAKIKRNVTVFLTDTWRSGALFGDTAADAFFIRCDESNNPKNLRDQGQVNIEIGVAIVRPAEFVVFTISQMNGA
jgi:hypothetical protein